MIFKNVEKAFSQRGDDPMPIIATLALQQVAAERFSETGQRAKVDAFPFFLSLVGARDYSGPDRTMAALSEARIAPETILDSLIPDMAALIGDQWLSDEMSWSTVTVISARLQTLAWRYIEPMMARMSAVSDAPTFLMIVPEGETHTLGGVLAIGALMREGVSAAGVFGEPDQRVFDIAANGAFGTIGVSTSGFGGKDRLAPLIEGLQARSPGSSLAVGGSISACNPQLLRELRGISHKVNPDDVIALLQSGLTKGRTFAQTGPRASVSNYSVA